jgi:hypothetical protein
MANQTLYAYAVGTDLDDVAAQIEARLDALVAERKWALADVWVVSQRELPHWDLGINMTLGSPRARPAEWIDDAIAVATQLAAIHRETGRSFVIGLHDPKTDATTDLFSIDSGSPDLDALRGKLAKST